MNGEHDMFIKKDSKFYDVPLIINVTLYKNNYFDNLIISEIRKNAYVLSSKKNVYSVDKDDLKRILRNKFKKEIERINAVPFDNLFTTVNSTYFLNNIVNSFKNLKMLNIEVSDKRNFSRVFYSNEQRLVGFDYRISQGILDFPKFLSTKQLSQLNKLLVITHMHNKEISIEMEPYYVIKSKDFINRIITVEKIYTDFVEDAQGLLSIIYEMIESKVEEDDSYLIIKTDF